MKEIRWYREGDVLETSDVEQKFWCRKSLKRHSSRVES